MDTKNIAVIVTGGASGLGCATAKYLAGRGARVAIFDRNVQQAEMVAKEINGLALQCDVADPVSAQQALHAAKKVHGVARVLVNCAGVAQGSRVVGKEGPMPLNEFEQVLRINLTGTFNMMRLAAADMIGEAPLDNGERGVIISTASVAAYEGQIGQAAYAASKGGVVSLTLPVARELSQFAIRVNAIAPGLFMTPLLAGLPVESIKNLSAVIPFPKRLGNADEYARLVAHLIENEYINGEIIRIDGALRMQPK